MSRFVMSKTPWERCPYPALKEALEKTDYNQTTLAEATGISATNVSRYVKGDVDVTVRACPNDLYCEACAMYSNNNGICNNGALPLRRPPQSWCYVEDMDNG